MNNETPGDVRPGHEAVYEQRVPLHDCDPLGIVWHGHYYKYLEIARTLLFEGLGIDVAFFQKNATSTPRPGASTHPNLPTRPRCPRLTVADA